MVTFIHSDLRTGPCTLNIIIYEPIILDLGYLELYVTVRRYQTDPKSMNELIRRIKEEFVPIISKVPGFMSYSVIDAGRGTLASISSFENKSGADESTRRAAEWVKSVKSLLPNPPQITAGDIVISTWPTK